LRLIVPRIKMILTLEMWRLAQKEVRTSPMIRIHLLCKENLLFNKMDQTVQK